MPSFGDCAVGSGPGGSDSDFCPRPVYRWQHRLTKRNPTGTEPKVRLEKQCEWKRGSEILRSSIMTAFPNSGKCTMRASCHSFPYEHFASRHPVKATLRLALLGLDRDPSRCTELILRGRNGKL